MDPPNWWLEEPEGVPRVAQGVPDRVARLRALGNGQVPLQAAMAWRILSRGFAHA
jgi:DNA (cytosine-5)-methyltransferase 1